MNFATELRVAYTDAEKQLLKENPETFDPKNWEIAAMKAVKETDHTANEDVWMYRKGTVVPHRCSKEGGKHQWERR